MGARPYIDWDPAENSGLVITPATGPRIFDASDPAALADLAKLVGLSIAPLNWAVVNEVYYAQQKTQLSGVAPEQGVRVRNYIYMPENMEFFGKDPVNGEPTPLDPDDLLVEYYISLGHRLPLRGYIGNATWGLAGTLRTKWGDSTIRNNGDTRGPYTGLVVNAFNTEDPQTGVLSEELFYVVHGKQATAAAYQYRGGYINAPALGGAGVEVAAAHAGVDEGECRIVISGASPWNIKSQYWDGANWQDLDVRAVNLVAGPVDPTFIGITGWLFAGQSKVAATPLGALLNTFFQEIEVPFFEPFVLNVAEWDVRDEWDSRHPWSANPGLPLLFGTPAVRIDLHHNPMGSTHAPEELRDYDDDLGWCVKMNPNTRLFAFAECDTRGVKQNKERALVSCDNNRLGIDAPFTAAIRLKMTGMGYDANAVGFFNFGDIFNPAAGAADNGIGLYKQGNQIMARMWRLGGWADAVGTFFTENHQDEVIDLALSWTGLRGKDAGYPDQQLRVLVNGQTLGVYTNTRNPAAEGTVHAEIGFTGDPAAVHGAAGWTGWFRKMRCCAAAMTDEEIRHIFDDPKTELTNEDFAVAGEDIGSADGWTWKAGTDITVPGGTDSLALFRQSPWPAPAEPYSWLDGWPAVMAVNAPTYDLSALSSNAVTALLGAPGNRIDVAGVDLTPLLQVGSSFRVTGSTGLDGYWTVQVIAFVAGTTRITTDEDVLTAVVDGNVEVPPALTVEIDTYTVQLAQFWDLYFVTPAAATGQEVVDVLNDYLQHAVCWTRGGQLWIRSERQGTGAKVEVTGGTANVAFAFPTAAVFGVDGVGWSASWSEVTSTAGVFFAGSDLRGNAETFEWTYWYETLVAAGQLQADHRSWYESRHTYDIAGVNVAPNGRFDIATDITAFVQNGDTLIVTGSTGNDGIYTVFSSVWAGGFTRITCNEAVTDATADGQLSPWVWHAVADTIDEGWESDQLSTTTRTNWFPGNIRNGRIYGEALTFPLSIPSNRRNLFVYSELGGADVFQLALATSTHATPAALVADLNAKLAAAIPGTALEFGFETVSTTQARIWFGWDGAAHLGAEESYFVSGLGALADQDVRRILGFDQLSPSGDLVQIAVPTGYYAGDNPSLWSDDDTYGIDPWSYIKIETELETHDGYEMPRNYSQPIAVFDVAVPDADQHERFKSTGWGGGAWIVPGAFAPTLANQFDAGAPNTAAFVDDTVGYPMAPFGGGETLTVRVDQGALQTLTFAGGEVTAADVAALINSQLDGATATVVGGQVRLSSDTVGTAGYIFVTGGTANAVLLFLVAEQQGTDHPAESVEDFEEGWI